MGQRSRRPREVRRFSCSREPPVRSRSNGVGCGRHECGRRCPSWADLTEAEERAKARKSEQDHDGFAKVQRRNHKCQRSDSSQQGRVIPPFPLDTDKRVEAVLTLAKEVAGKSYVTCKWIFEIISKRYPDLPRKKARALANMILMVVSEWQMTTAMCGSFGMGPVLPEEILDYLPELDTYVGGGLPEVSNDVHRIKRANSLHFAVWFHRLDMYWIQGSHRELSMNETDCEVPLWVSTGCSAWRALGTAKTVTRVP